jgi:hypothetical protein
VSRQGRIAIAGSTCAPLALLAWSVAVELEFPVGVPRSQRLGALDPRDERPQAFPFRVPHRMVGFSLVSAETGGHTALRPEGLPEALSIRILSGAREIATQEIAATDLTSTNWHEPHRACFFRPTVKLEPGSRCTLEMSPRGAGNGPQRLQVVLESIDEGKP